MVESESHFEQEDNDAQSSEDVDEPVGLEIVEAGVAHQHEVANDHTDDQFAEHGGLTEACGDFAADFGGDEDQRQRKGQLGNRIRVGCRGGRRRDEEGIDWHECARVAFGFVS